MCQTKTSELSISIVQYKQELLNSIIAYNQSTFDFVCIWTDREVFWDSFKFFSFSLFLIHIRTIAIRANILRTAEGLQSITLLLKNKFP
jgi:hypothetical protein